MSSELTVSKHYFQGSREDDLACGHTGDSRPLSGTSKLPFQVKTKNLLTTSNIDIYLKNIHKWSIPKAFFIGFRNEGNINQYLYGGRVARRRHAPCPVCLCCQVYVILKKEKNKFLSLFSSFRTLTFWAFSEMK